MQVTTFAISEQGTRDHNDDAFADAELAGGRCLVVADGAGGHQGGAVAARIVTESVLLRLASAIAFDDAALLAAVDAASRDVHRRQATDHRLREMSSTVVMLCLDIAAATAHWTHLGDSRLLRFRRGVAEQLTIDHSVVQSFIDAGLEVSDLAGGGPCRSVLYAAVGAEGETRPVVSTMRGLKDGDAFLLCSDGVWDTVTVDEMQRLLALSVSVREWVEAIAEAVRRAAQPHQDNYTALGVWLGSPAEITVIRV